MKAVILTTLFFFYSWTDIAKGEALLPFQGIPKKEPPPTGNISFNKYNSYEQIVGYLAKLAKEKSDVAQLLTTGTSSEGRPIFAIRISENVQSAGIKPVIIIDGGIHGREWAAPAVATYLIHQLVENSEHNINLLRDWDWYILPCLNPDGYEYSRKEDRMWRKNRANTTEPHCPGIDLNRNFDIFFGGQGTSRDPCDETYIGREPFSEPETRALRDLAMRLKPRTRLYFTLHSYGQSFLYPWGFGDVLPRDWKDLDRLARLAGAALASVRGTTYAVGSSTQLLGPAAGGSDDWMKARAGAKYSYTVELPAGGEEGFDLPEKDILGVAVEMFVGIKKAAGVAADELKSLATAQLEQYQRSINSYTPRR